MSIAGGIPIARTLTFAALLALAAGPGQAYAQDEAKLAGQLVKTSAAVQPGDHVVIAGGKHNLGMMEAIAIEAQKAGGMVTMLVNSDRVLRSTWTEVPDEYLKQVPTYWKAWLDNVDVWIGLPAIENPQATFGDIPQEKFALAAESNQFFNDELNSTPLRGVAIMYPTAAEAQQNGLDFGTYSTMQWAAVGADYGAISRNGNALAAKLKGAKEVRVTSPAGTDVRFAIGGRTVFVDDGIVTPEEAKSKFFVQRWASLPGGQVFTSVDEGSGAGTVVVPKTRCQYEPMTDVRFTLDDGYIESLQAGANASCFESAMAPYDKAAMRIGTFSIGLNPALKVLEENGADYRPGDAAGMVWLGFGDNQLAGGKNETTGSFNFPIVNATVTVDGTVVVRDGKLVGN
jgi:leucyl aminopeptidase (aminopeptidase T)